MQLEEVDDDFMRPTEAIKTIANDYADYQARKLSGLLGLFSPVSESVYGLLQKFGVDPYADIEVGPKDPWYIITSRNLHAGKEGTLARSVNDFIADSAPVWRHHHMFSNGNEDIGFTDTGEFKENQRFMSEYRHPTSYDGKRYSEEAVRRGIELRHQAAEDIEQLVADRPDLFEDAVVPNLNEYDGLLNNCHDYVADVLWRGAGYSGR